MEDLPVKAIVIGVSVFVTMTVLSAVIIYFNTAKGVAEQVSKRVDIADTYDAIMNDENFEDNLTGVEVRSLIIKYAGNKDVRINIVSISGEETNDYNNINNRWLKKISNDANLISEEKLDLINPVWKCSVEKAKSGEITTLNVSMNIDMEE